MEKYEEQIESMKIIIVHGYQHIIMPYRRTMVNENIVYPNPNYRGTGMALVGVLKKGQTLNQFKKQWLKNKKKWSSQQ